MSKRARSTLRILPFSGRIGHDLGHPELVGELLRDPPAGLLLVGRRDDRLPQRDPAATSPADLQLVVAFEEHRLGQHDVRVAGDLARHRVDDDQQVEAVDRLDGLGAVRQCLDDVRGVDEPALDRVRLARNGGFPDSRGDLFVGERILLAVRVVGVGLGALRILRQRVTRDLDAVLDVDAAAPSPVAEQRVQQRNSTAALRVVAVPVDAASRVDQRGRPAQRQLPRGLADQRRVEAGLGGGPLGRGRLDLLDELVEAESVLRDEGPVVPAFGDEDVHPRQQQGEVGARLDRQPVLRLARRHRVARVDHDDRDPARHRVGELLHLQVVHVLAEVRTDQHQAVGVLDVGRFGRAEALAVGQVEADVARAAALCERGAGHVDAPVALQHVLDEAHADAVVQHGDRFRPVRALDLLHAVGDVRQRLVPGRRLPRVLAAFAGPDQRRAQAVRIVDRARRAAAARAQPSAALRVDGIALELPHLAVAHRGEAGTAPEAHLAEGRNGRDLAGGSGGVGEVGEGWDLGGGGAGTERCCGDLQESPA